MPIMYEEEKKGLLCPRVFCDECGERILKASDANVCFVSRGKEEKRYLNPKKGDRYGIGISCKGCVMVSNKKYLCMEELHHFFFYLSNNIDTETEKAKACCVAVAKLF